MHDGKTVPIFEYGWLVVDEEYDGIKFTSHHHKLLAQYLTQNPGCGYYSVYYDRIRFCNYVGVIKIAELTIEVLPKTDKHNLNKAIWQKLLLEMLAISLRVKARTTTSASVHIRQYDVLESYLKMFVEEVQVLMHQGLVKKYRSNEANQNALKGRLLVHQNVCKNVVHAERFYVNHQVYDRDNLYNSILFQALDAVRSLASSMGLAKVTEKLLIDFPECTAVNISDGLFTRISYDRKTERYKTAIEFARIILLNYHPDLRGGNNNILAIMFDMNYLWETYIFSILSQCPVVDDFSYTILEQDEKSYWKHPDNGSFHLRPDITIKNELTGETVVLDTKWKYDSDSDIADVRQMYAYGHYFKADRRYLLYPGDGDVSISDGYFYDVQEETWSLTQKCGLMYVNPFNTDKELNTTLGKAIIKKLFLK